MGKQRAWLGSNFAMQLSSIWGHLTGSGLSREHQVFVGFHVYPCDSSPLLQGASNISGVGYHIRQLHEPLTIQERCKHIGFVSLTSGGMTCQVSHLSR